MSQNDPVWSARIPTDVKEYLQNKKGLSAGQCLIEYCKILKSQELPEAIQELSRRKESVLQQEAFVLQLQSENTTKSKSCSTAFEQLKKRYIELGRSSDQPTTQDKSWITAQCKKMKIDPEEFLKYLMGGDE